MVSDLRHWGAPEAMVEAAIAELAPTARSPVFPVHRDNVTAIRLFLAMSTQWNVLSISTLSHAQVRRIGLRYEVLETVARGRGFQLGDRDFERIQLLETTALNAWAEERA